MANKEFLSKTRTQELIDTSKEKFIRNASDSASSLALADNVGLAITLVKANGTEEILGFQAVN